MAGTLTRTQMVTEVANTVGRLIATKATDATTTLETRIRDYWIEWAKLRVARAFSFPELDISSTALSLTIDDGNYAFTDIFASIKIKDILHFAIIDGTSSRKLTRWNYRRFDERFPNPAGDSSGKPSIYSVFGQNVLLWQLPDTAYTTNARASKFPDAFTGDSDTLPWDNMDDVIVTATVYESLLRLGETELAKDWFRDLKDRIKEAARPFIDGPEDWEPEGRAFGSNIISPSDYWNDPFNINPTGP